MDVILTSFGTGMETDVYEIGACESQSLFYRMPPLMFEERGTFRLDYAALFMFDRIIVDQKTYNQAIDTKLEDYEGYELNSNIIRMLRKSIAEYSEFFKALKSSGHLITKDFDDIFSRVKEIWQQATDRDMKNITGWVKPLELSLEKWEKVAKHFMNGIEGWWDSLKVNWDEIPLFMPYRPHALTVYDYAMNELHILKNWKKKQSKESRNFSRETLRDYLSYINFNLILSFQFKAAFIDWEDMQPFYDKKFTIADRRKPSEVQIAQQSRKLFDLLFPHFVPKTPQSLIRAIEDKRIEELKLLIHKSLEGSEDFDSDFAIRTLKEVLKFEHKAIVRRKISGWATMPLGFIPFVGTGIQKAVEELINALWSNRDLRKYQWYYLINEIDASPSRQGE